MRPSQSALKATRRARQQEIAKLIGEACDGKSLLGSHRKLSRKEYVKRVCQLLVKLGPTFSSFGLLLASRPDLMKLPDCLQLNRIPRTRAAESPDCVRQTIQGEQGRTDDYSRSHFARFEKVPFESYLHYQLHYGELENGERVVVRVNHSLTGMDTDLQLLHLLSDILDPILAAPGLLVGAIEEFRETSVAELDGRRVAASMQSLAEETREFNSIKIPKVYLELCSLNVLVTERLDGLRLDRYIAARQANNRNYKDWRASGRGEAEPTMDAEFEAQRYLPAEIAGNLTELWLSQAFGSSVLFTHLRPDNVLIRSSTEFAILDANYIKLTRSMRNNWLDYLVASDADEPTQALTALLKELDSSRAKISESMLDRHFRQVVSFRDGGWEDGGRANCLADTLFTQWHLLSANGYRPLRSLTRTFAATFHIANLARQIEPANDALSQGVKNQQLTKMLNDLSTILQTGYWGGQSDRLMGLLMMSPSNLNHALNQLKDISSADRNGYATCVSNRTARQPLLIALFCLVTLHEITWPHYSSIVAQALLAYLLYISSTQSR